MNLTKTLNRLNLWKTTAKPLDSSITRLHTCIESVNSIPKTHPWPEWVSFIDTLKSRGYFPSSSSSSSSSSQLVYFEHKLVKDPCFSFARDRFDLFHSLSKDDIRNIVEIGCPELLRKVINSAKRLREYVGLEEKTVCDVCSLRESCDRAYLKPNDSENVRTLDIMRLILFYALEPTVISGSVKSTSIEQAQSSARRLLSILIELSESTKCQDSVETPYKGKIVNSNATVVPQAMESSRMEWVCPKNNQGQICKEDTPEKRESEHVELKPGDWNCPRCQRLNFARRTLCHHCKALRPPESLNPGEWVCSVCNYLNFRRNAKCLKCETEPVKKAASQDDHKRAKTASPSMTGSNTIEDDLC